MKKMLFEVAVHRASSFDNYRVLAIDDIAAREKAVELDNKAEKECGEELGEIIYCEIELISKTD